MATARIKRPLIMSVPAIVTHHASPVGTATRLVAAPLCSARTGTAYGWCLRPYPAGLISTFLRIAVKTLLPRCFNEQCKVQCKVHSALDPWLLVCFLCFLFSILARLLEFLPRRQRRHALSKAHSIRTWCDTGIDAQIRMGL